MDLDTKYIARILHYLFSSSFTIVFIKILRYSNGGGWGLDVLVPPFVVQDVCNTIDKVLVVCTIF